MAAWPCLCLVPFTSFCEYADTKPRKTPRAGFACRNLHTANRTRTVEATVVTAIKPAMVLAQGDALGSPCLVTRGSIAWPLIDGP
jgi:hypothetical protein